MHEQNGASVQPYVQAEATAGVAPIDEGQPVAYLIEGFDGSGKLYARIVHFTVDEARNSAAEFVRHYSTVTTTPLVRAAAGVPVPHPNLPTDHKSAPIQKRDKPKPDAGVAPCDGGEK